MTREFDPKKSYLTLKAHEKMIAYASFCFQYEDQDKGKEGVLKISAFHRAYGGEQLTLTFIVDTEGNQALRRRLDKLFENITAKSVRPHLGKSFEKLVKVSLDDLAHMLSKIAPTCLSKKGSFRPWKMFSNLNLRA
jgi:hypothetical protein